MVWQTALLLFATFTSLVGAKTVTYYLEILEDATDLYDLNHVAVVGWGALFNPEPETNFTRYTAYINSTYPAPLIEADEGDTIKLVITNSMIEFATLIHLHGMTQADTPWEDGSPMVSECPLPNKQTITKFITAEPAGTHMYHSHMQEQALLGVVGPLIIHPASDPHASLYDEEQIMMVSDIYENPQHLHTNFWTPLEYVSFNGLYGEGSEEYPYYQLNVDAGKCYRLRWISALFELCGCNIQIEEHKQTVIADDGHDLTPFDVDTISLIPGKRLDTVLCADQEPGNYWITLDAPAKYSFPGLDESFQTLGQKFHAVLHYNEAEEPDMGEGDQSEIDEEDKGLVYDIVWNLEDIAPLVSDPLPEATMYRELDIGSIMLENIPVDGELGSGGAIQYEFYFWDEPMYYPHRYVEATTPILHTGGTCCMDENTHVINIDEENQVLDLVINNRNNLVHSMHLHGHKFYVIGNGYNLDGNVGFEEANGDDSLAPCDEPRRSDSSAKSADRWGCPYDPELDADRLNFDNPPMMDTVGVPPYSWVYIRYVADTPGAWAFHCHTYDHTLRGMKMVLNVLPDQVNVPDSALKCGPCADYSDEQTECPADLFSSVGTSSSASSCLNACDSTATSDLATCEADLDNCYSNAICEQDEEDWSCDCQELYDCCEKVAEGRRRSCDAQCDSSTSEGSGGSEVVVTSGADPDTDDRDATDASTTVNRNSRENDPDVDDRS